jgi:Helix-turn-helix domain
MGWWMSTHEHISTLERSPVVCSCRSERAPCCCCSCNYSNSLAELRRNLAITQEELADALNVNQPAISKLERADDVSVSRLRCAVEALGGELELGVRIDGVLFPLHLNERATA